MGSAQLTARAGSRRLASYAVLALLALTGTLLLITLVPLAFGWSPSVVLSGSMQPEVAPGDVVLAQPIAPQDLVPGRVIRFADPADAGRYLVHRIVEVNPDGTIVTKGDANRVRDSRTVTASQVTGVLRLRVPWVGLPRLWVVNGAYGRLLALAGAVALAWSLMWPGRMASPRRHQAGRATGRHRRI
jgi:signal peptidase